MFKSRSHLEVQFRSLLQKAVRRGHTDLVLTTSALLGDLGSREKNWYRTRTAIITFEECWPLGSELTFNRKFHSKVAALINVTRSAKSRDAAWKRHAGERGVNCRMFRNVSVAAKVPRSANAIVQ